MLMRHVPSAESTASLAPWRRLPVGAEPLPSGGGVHFRTWAPACSRLSVVIEQGPGASVESVLEPEPGDSGYFSGTVAGAAIGNLYRFRLDGKERLLPDPASRFQPEGPHGPSEVVAGGDAFDWSDKGWRGLELKGQVFYEMHIGTFTPEGTWRAATAHLESLAELGVTAIELMPVADFPGRFGWGYDGVCWFAPTRLYGRPDDFRRFVDVAHGLGLGVVLDVVYNHFGPDGCYLREFAPAYFSDKHRSEWGDSPNFDGPGCGPVREMVLANVAHWIADYRLDGLRLDATQSIVDDSRPHILSEIGRQARAAAPGRKVLIVSEDEPQRAHLMRPRDQGGHGLDMVWNDDWHHAAHVAATGQDDAYYTDYRGRAQEFVSAAKYGFLYQGQWYRWQGQRRGSPALDIEPARFVHFLANHDQVANAGFRERPHAQASPGRWRALTALLLLGPQTPLLFQGQEFAASAPFLFFADHHPGLARDVARGRGEFAAQFATLGLPEVARLLPAPHDPETFERCRLDHAERGKPGHAQTLRLHRDLLKLRRGDPCFSAQAHRGVDGAVLGADAFVLRFFGVGGDDRLLLVNLGRALHLDPAPEPLLAPCLGGTWRMAWSSQDPAYGGVGALHPERAQADRRIPGRDLPRPFDNWWLQAETAVVLAPEPPGGEGRLP